MAHEDREAEVAQDGSGSMPAAQGRDVGDRAPRVGSTIKHYELLRKLGEGGMGTVYVARDTTLGRLVAIKVLQMQAGPNAKRFLIEAQATARCRHDNIVVIHDVDEFQGHPYMVLEYLEGYTLREWMAQRDPSPGPVPPSLAVELLLPVVRALSCAHRLGIVHRDLKPENIFLTGTGRVVVLDFGIAKRLEASRISAINATARLRGKGAGLTQDGALVGTLPYMSPEQLRAEDVDARSDLWAVGILLYELVTGAHPLTYRSVFELLDIGESEEPMPSVRDQRPDVGALGAIIDRCLQKPRTRRYGSAEQLVAALEALVQRDQASEPGEPVNRRASAPIPNVLATGRRTPTSVGAVAGHPLALVGPSASQEVDPERRAGQEREVVGLVDRLGNQPLVVQDAQFVARLHAAAQPWEASHEAPGLLWRDRAAREAAEWLTRRRAEQAAGESLGLGKHEERFLLAVVALSERDQRRRQWILAGGLATVSGIAVVVSLLAIDARRQAARADRAEQAARSAQSEAQQARNATRMAVARELEQSDLTTVLALLREVEPPGVPRGWAELASKALQRPLAPLRGTDDPSLWTATSYCMSVERRVALLSVSEASARADQDACERRVKAAGAAATEASAGGR